MDEPAKAAAPFETYSLEEVAAMVLPPEMKDGPRWLAARLRRGAIRGYKIGRHWRMTHADVEDLIAKHRNKPASAATERTEGEQFPRGLSRRSWMNHQRCEPEGSSCMQVPKKWPVRETAEAPPFSGYFRPVVAADPAAVAKMPELTRNALALLERLRREGEVVVTGRQGKTVAALVRRGLATYQVEYALNEKHSYYYYRFSVRLAAT